MYKLMLYKEENININCESQCKKYIQLMILSNTIYTINVDESNWEEKLFFFIKKIHLNFNYEIFDLLKNELKLILYSNTNDYLTARYDCNFSESKKITIFQFKIDMYLQKIVKSYHSYNFIVKKGLFIKKQVFNNINLGESSQYNFATNYNKKAVFLNQFIVNEITNSLGQSLIKKNVNLFISNISFFNKFENADCSDFDLVITSTPFCCYDLNGKEIKERYIIKNSNIVDFIYFDDFDNPIGDALVENLGKTSNHEFINLDLKLSKSSDKYNYIGIWEDSVISYDMKNGLFVIYLTMINEFNESKIYKNSVSLNNFINSLYKTKGGLIYEID